MAVNYESYLHMDRTSPVCRRIYSVNQPKVTQVQILTELYANAFKVGFGCMFIYSLW